MTNILNKTKEVLFKFTLGFTGVWLIFALSFQTYAIFLTVSGQDEKMRNLSNEITLRTAPISQFLSNILIGYRMIL